MYTPALANQLLSCLRAHGQCVDSEIAQETGITVSEVREHFAELLTSGEVIACKLTRYDKGKPVDSMMYRASGYFPRFGAGRKPASVVVTSRPSAATLDPL